MPPTAPPSPTTPEPSSQQAPIADLIAQSFLNLESYSGSNSDQKSQIRVILQDFLDVVRDPERVLRNIKNDTLTPSERKMLERLAANSADTDTFIQGYVNVVDVDFTGVDNDANKLKGYRLQYLVASYQQYKQESDQKRENQDPYDLINEKLSAMGQGFTGYFDFLDTDKKLRNIMLRPGKFREDFGPAQTMPYQCRIGGSTFFIPPTSITVHQGFKSGSLSGGVLRQPNSAKTNLGHSETSINMTLYFPNHEMIWGFKGDTGKDLDIFNWDPIPTIRKDTSQIADNVQVVKNIVSDSVIDFYLASLRGLVTQFKYSPILPIKNEFLNRTFDIDAVALMGMTVSTLPDFPFVLVVNLELAKYNYTPLMPMIQDFDQAIHWGKFRQYMGRAAARLDSKVNQGFLTQTGSPLPSQNPHEDPNLLPSMTTSNVLVKAEGDLIPRFDKVKDISDGRNFNFYYPVSDPARIFAPDTTDFRQPGEDLYVSKDDWDFILGSLGFNLVDAPQFNFFEFDRAYRNSKYRSEAKVLQQWLAANKVAWQYMSGDKKAQFIEEQVKLGKANGNINKDNESSIRARLGSEWFFEVYKILITENASLKEIQKSRVNYADYTINEWQIPMEKLYIDWDRCIVSGVSVSLSNNFAKMQVQLQDEPTYQHIGGGDSQIQVSMIIIGEDNLLRFRRLFDHINGLARIEQAHGVLGFLGIKNVITSLCGIKYVLPLDFETETVPNFPHVYRVTMSFIDFDVMQQEREKISSEQQLDLVNTFGKRNPFLRLKQSWGVFNAYPDFPLDIRDENGNIVGHLDPDWYFRSFDTSTSDKDLFTWNFDPNVLKIIQSISKINESLEIGSNLEDENKLDARRKELTRQLKDLIDKGAVIPSYWDIADGKLTRTFQDPNSKDPMPEPEMTIHLGSYNEDKSKSSVLCFFEGGYVAFGVKDVKTGETDYSIGMSYFAEDLASSNLKGLKTAEGITPLADYQKEYVDGVESPNQQFQNIMMDYNYRNIRGRMLRAFPTYMLWLIDEGGRFAGIKLFDNFYGINSVIDFSVVQSEKPLEDTLILRLSNIYHKLTTPYREEIISEDSELYGTAIGQWIATALNRERNIESGLTDKVIELNNIRLKPGVRIHLRMGYSANPNALQTVFNGVITEVQPGDIITVTAQSDAVEFSGMVNTVNPKGSSGKLDGGVNTGFWMSEPRDLIVRLLTMGSSNFKEWVAWGSKGVFFSDSRFGIRHFGSMLYEPMSSTESEGSAKMLSAVGGALQSTADMKGFSGLLGGATSYGKDIASIVESAAIGSDVNLNSSLMQIGQLLWTNSFAKRDYEIFKRNIYPGNGTGVAQFMGGDQIDAGITVSSAITYFNSEPSQQNAQINTVNSAISSGKVTLTKSQQTILNSATDTNEKNSQIVQKAIDESDGATDQEILDLMRSGNLSATKININESDEFSKRGLIDDILSPFKTAWNLADSYTSYVNDFIDDIPINGLTGGTLKLTLKSLLPGTGLVDGVNRFTGLMGGLGRIASGGSPIGHVLGLSSPMPDDDLKGFDEVSFRAQTYMKSVWDLFELCAALLPNYIIAVRPFEDRSTLFYGKPHWLYTSGVIPITTGIPKDKNLRPLIEAADKLEAQLREDARKATNKEAERMMTVVDKTKELRDIMGFSAGKDYDPYNVGGDSTIGVNLSTEADIEKLVAEVTKDGDQVNLIEAIKTLNMQELTLLPITTLQTIIEDYNPSKVVDPEMVKNIANSLKTKIEEAIQEQKNRTPQVKRGIDIFDDPSLRTVINGENKGDVYNAVEAYASSIQSPDVKKAFLDFANNDPLTFAYQFGWKFATVPTWIDPETGYGVDKVGQAAKRLYDSNYDDGSASLGGKRSQDESYDIWETIRNKGDGIADKSKSAYDQFFPMPEQQSKYEDVWELFLRFLWQDPYNRAWAIVVPDKTGDGVIDTVNPFGDNSNHWNFDKLIAAWQVFISSDDIEIDSSTNIVTSSAARSYMVANAKPGKDAHSFAFGVAEDVKDWFDSNIGQVIGMIGSTISGFIASIRSSLAQIGNALSMSGTFQKQANIMNAALNDSIYYQMGDGPDDILRLVDNPFTREYGEPVVEVREPFQRLHYISSFDNIITNGIAENLEGVATVVTATSDGKHPVTVHFDKGVPPDRQVEKVVETGLLWDNAIGGGLFGFLQPLLHPLESLRSVAKIATGSSDELSARRVALYHLRESLKQIYQGEVLIMGDADIRPFDLVYMADIYERMYGMFEVRQVIHHFTPETGFVTAIVPNAVVTVNDPVRYSLLSYAWSKMSNYNLRDDMRAYLGIKTDRAVADATKEVDSSDIYKNFSTQMQGAIQYTHGNSAIVRDVGAVFTGGGVKALTARDELINKAATVDMTLKLGTAGLEIGGAIIGGVATMSPQGALVGGAGGWVVGDLIWEAWNWVKENLLDQHGCYIQYMNKDGQPMDSGLGYYQGVAVGTNHTMKLLPAAFGLNTGRVNYIDSQGHYRITTNDLLSALGWTEFETASLYKDTSMFVNQQNTKILKIAGRDAVTVPNDHFMTVTGTIIAPEGESINGQKWIGIQDGDTINVKVIDGQGSIAPGSVMKVRLSVVNTYELQNHDNPNTPENETELSPANDLGRLAYQYLVNKFANVQSRTVAIRIDKRNPRSYDRYIGTIFHNIPFATPLSERLSTLQNYAAQYPPISFDDYLPDGRPYTLNWEMVMTGYGNVDMRESLWETTWRNNATNIKVNGT